jgi:hypothetical protein
MPRLLLPLLCLLTACTHWVPIADPTPDPARIEPGPIRIVGTDSFVRLGRTVTIDPQMVRFSRTDATLDSLPRAAVARFEKRKFNATGTIALIGAFVITGIVLSEAMGDMFTGSGSVTY